MITLTGSEPALGGLIEPAGESRAMPSPARIICGATGDEALDSRSVRACRILVVDDNSEIHVAFRRALEPHGSQKAMELDRLEAALNTHQPHRQDQRSTPTVHVESAYQGEHGCESVRSAIEKGDSFAVAFVDVRMPPGLNGIEASARMLELDPDLQIVICTAYADFTWEAMIDRLNDPERWVVLKKPFEAIEVRQLVRSLSEKRRLTMTQRRRQEELEALVEERTATLDAARQELRRAQRLEALGRLAAGIGHEMNNPLTYVQGNIEFALKWVDRLESAPGGLGARAFTAHEASAESLAIGADGSSGEAEPGREAADPSVSQYPETSDLRSMLNACLEGTQRLCRLAGSLRSFRRRRATAAEPVDLRPVLELAVQLTASAVRPRALLKLDLTESQLVHGNAPDLEQVFINLLLNAAEAIVEGRPRENEIVVRSQDEQGRVVVFVRDTGVGIPAENLERVFDPFFTTRPVGQNMGLGLAVSHEIISGLGGRLTLESDPDRGTVARVELPAAESNRRPEARPEQYRPDRRPSIVVVDDEPLVCRILERMLAHTDVVSAGSGREGIEVALERDPDLILCDIMMDGLSGIDVYRRLQEIRPGLEERIVFITGGVFTDAVGAFANEVSNPILEKPIDPRRLEALVEQAVRDRERHRPKIG